MMRNQSRMLLTASATSVILFVTVGIAGAGRIGLSSQGFRAVWSTLNFSGAGQTMGCPITLEGSFHSRTISKVCGQLVGYITRVFVREASCTGGATRALTETLPWHVQYLGFIGTLPNITGIRLIFVGWRWRFSEPNGLICLYGTTQAHPSAGIANVEAGGSARTLRADESLLIPLGGEFLCELLGEEGRFSGTAETFVLGSTTTRITVRLVQ